MKDLWENRIIHHILAIALITALLGFAPNPHRVEVALIRATRARSYGFPLHVSQNLAIAAESVPWLSHLWEPAGQYALDGGATDQAIAHYKHAAASGSLSPEGYTQFGDAYLASGNPFTAIQIWSARSQIYGPSPKTLDRITVQQRNSQDYPGLITTLKSRIQYEHSRSSNPETIASLNYELGLTLAAVNPEAAPPYLLQAAETNPVLTSANHLAFAIQRALPNDNPAYTRMASGQALASIDQWELAAYAFQQVTQTHPDYSEAWAYLGETRQHLTKPDPQRALQALQTAFDLDPTSLPANTYLAVYWQRNGSPERAKPYLTTAAQLDPSNPDILVDLGAVTAILGDLETAVEHYKKAIEITNRNPEYIRKLGEFCIRFNYHIADVALPLARQSLLTSPHDPGTLDLMGQILFRLGDLFNAERFLLQAISEDPGYAPAHLHYGLVLQLQGKPLPAAQAFEQAISLAPDTSTAVLATRFLEDMTQP